MDNFSRKENRRYFYNSYERIKILDSHLENSCLFEPLREANQGHSPPAKKLAHEVGEKLNKLITNLDKAMCVKVPEQTLDGRLEQASRWLQNPKKPDNGLGALASRAIIGQARKVAFACPDEELMTKLVKDTNLAEQLIPKVLETEDQDTADQLNDLLHGLKSGIEDALVTCIADRFADTQTALKKLKAAAGSDLNTANREINFKTAEKNFLEQAKSLTNLARQAAECASRNNPKMAENIRATANKVDVLTDQVIGSAKVVFADPTANAAKEHFDNTCEEWTNLMNDLTTFVDDTQDAYAFVCAVEKGLIKDHKTCESAIDIVD